MEKENVIPNIFVASDSPRKHVGSPRKSKTTKGKGSPMPKSPSRAPISSKITFFELHDAHNTHPAEQRGNCSFPEIREKIDFYERLFMAKGSSKRDVVIKHDEWKKMMGDLLGQVQAKADELKASEDRAVVAEQWAEKSKEEYEALDKELKAKTAENAQLSEKLMRKAERKAALKARVAELESTNKSLTDTHRVLETQATQDRHYSECAEGKVEQMLVEILAEQERANAAQAEVDFRNTEIEAMEKKLASRNAELKLYKTKVEHFLTLLETRTNTTPTKKRVSICSEASTSSSASKKPRPSPAFSCPSPRFEYKFDPTRYETSK